MKITANDIAKYLGATLNGEDTAIERYAQLTAPLPHSIVFAKKYSDETVLALNKCNDILAIVTRDYVGKLTCSHIISDNPRLDYIRAFGRDVFIGAGCYVSAQCVVGDGCVLHPNVVLDNRVVLGHHCEIKSGAVLGQEGFGFERNEEGEPVHFPHFGDVIVGNNVFIGSNTTVERATLGSTVIEDNVKIDDLVQIGHNSHIGEGSMVTVGAIVCGGAVLNPQSYLAPNVTVKEKVSIGYRGFAGIGAVVLKDVADNTIVAGVPARELKNKN